MADRSALAALPPTRGAKPLVPTVVPAAGGVLVVQVRPLSITLSVRKSEAGPDLVQLHLSHSQWSALVEDADVGILATRLGLLPPPVGVQ